MKSVAVLITLLLFLIQSINVSSSSSEKRNNCFCTSGPIEGTEQFDFSLRQDCLDGFVAVISNPYPYCVCECCKIMDPENGKIDCEYRVAENVPNLFPNQN